MTSVTIPNSVTSIGILAFYGCRGLTSVTILCPKVGSWFSGNKSIIEIDLGDGVQSIGESAFEGCSGLTSVTLSKSVISVGEKAFEGCIGLTSVNIGDISSWCKISFKFNGSNPLSYAHHLLLNGTEIRDLIIPNSVTSIGNLAFYGCSGLASVTMGNSVTSIGSYAFSGCSGLTSVTIGNSVTSIGYRAFESCSGLTSVTSLNKTPPEISNNTFSEETYQTATLNVPLGCQAIYWLHPYWENFAKIEEIDVTAISHLEIEEIEYQNEFIYNLQGERMNVKSDELYKLPKSIYIVNGKKYFVK